MEKINFINQSTPALNATNLNKLQDNVEDAIEEVQSDTNTKLSADNVKTTQTTSDIDTYSCNYINNIVESGSNSNGNYIKYVDGTMICYKQISGNSNLALWGGSIYYSDTEAGTFPQSFISTPAVLVTNQTNQFWCSVDNPSTSGYSSIRILKPDNANKPYQIGILAIGKWK